MIDTGISSKSIDGMKDCEDLSPEKKNAEGRSRNLCRKFLLFLAALLIGLFLAEGFIRLFMPQKLITRYSHVWRPDDISGWRRRENLNTTINSGERLVHFVTDDNGYRINWEEREYDGFERQISILAIGDSFLEAVQVENRYTIPQIIKKKLSSKYKISVSVTNDSAGHWNPNHYYIEARRLAGNGYDLAIIFLCVSNDIVSSKVDSFPPSRIAQRHRFRFPRRLKHAEIVDSILYPINDTLECTSHLFVMIKNNTKWLRIKLDLSPYYFPGVFMRDTPQFNRWEITAEICKSIHDEFSANNVPCLFVLLPPDYQVDGEMFHRYAESFGIDEASTDLDQPNRLLKESFESKSLMLVDPLEYMRGKAAAGLSMYGLVDNHFNENGHQAVADYIMPVVESLVVDTVSLLRIILHDDGNNSDNEPEE